MPQDSAKDVLIKMCDRLKETVEDLPDARYEIIRWHKESNSIAIISGQHDDCNPEILEIDPLARIVSNSVYAVMGINEEILRGVRIRKERENTVKKHLVGKYCKT